MIHADYFFHRIIEQLVSIFFFLFGGYLLFLTDKFSLCSCPFLTHKVKPLHKISKLMNHLGLMIQTFPQKENNLIVTVHKPSYQFTFFDCRVTCNSMSRNAFQSLTNEVD